MRALVAAATLALTAGCADSEPAPQAKPRQKPSRPPVTVRCPPDVAGCRVASGRILYVERVDPDGDGDAHFVLASRASITAPGISAIDVRRDLRPKPLPGPGDRVSAAGPVQVGSHGQRQIHALRLAVAR